MRFQGALIREQGQTFAIVIVNEDVLRNSYEGQKARSTFSNFFPRMPIVLMAQNNRGVPTYQGRHDIVNFLVNVPLLTLPWKEYTVK